MKVVGQDWILETTGVLRRHGRVVLVDRPLWSLGVQGGPGRDG